MFFDDDYDSLFELLSERQQAILTFIESFLDDFGYPPSIREIGHACDIRSTSVVNYNLNKLVDGNWLERDAEKSRGIRIKRRRPSPELAVQAVREANTTLVPLYGHIAAGEAIEVPEDVGQYFDPDLDTVEVPRDMLGRATEQGVFAMRVQGTSMIDALIDDGDIVVLRAQQTCDDGEMVAVWLPEDNATTLKVFYDEGSQIRLQPRNPTMDPIFVHPNNCQIKGRVLGVLRTLH